MPAVRLRATCFGASLADAVARHARRGPARISDQPETRDTPVESVAGLCGEPPHTSSPRTRPPQCYQGRNKSYTPACFMARERNPGCVRGGYPPQPGGARSTGRGAEARVRPFQVRACESGRGSSHRRQCNTSYLSAINLTLTHASGSRHTQPEMPARATHRNPAGLCASLRSRGTNSEPFYVRGCELGTGTSHLGGKW